MSHPREPREAPGERDEVVALTDIARDEADALDQLFQLYAHDFSEHVPLPIAPTGRFAVTAGELWWTRSDHHAFFVRVAGRLAGFALARRGSRISAETDVMDVAEFFVLRGERRKRVGQRAAQALLTRFPGRWEVRVRQSNPAALAFWSTVLEAQASAAPHLGAFAANGVDWHVLRAEVLLRV